MYDLRQQVEGRGDRVQDFGGDPSQVLIGRLQFILHFCVRQRLLCGHIIRQIAETQLRAFNFMELRYKHL